MNREYVVVIVFVKNATKGLLMVLMSICTLYVKNVYMTTRDGRPAPHCGEGGIGFLPRSAPQK